ncbi:NAD(P)/FAD-dependent oxidoreductase [Saccharopolyspora sp. NFXS83]|uniref:dihydrolipoyl dehydrogenase family protein n=1 Tax=Saccharopolyspora sp. NFXS83 TaxID=2993560 RepID=UPI00224B69E6|nr:NAD(P)/FAD-dependent oxidoreductase [Saccharopolyspora sp. NFXS83]MCX2730333.1 NAD(P)/FAD-dependent oxidoreductase [Saccharopolyspora sp. NFXS83]
MATEEVDAVVIGMGPGGEDVAGRLATAGLDVVAVESRLVGGECPYYACIPTKMMVRAADALGEARRVPELAGSATVRPDFTPVADRIRDEATTGWDDTAAVERFERTGGRLVRGRGRITAPGEVTVTTDSGPRTFHARKAIVLNPGTEPTVPPIDGLADTPYWTNRGAVAARTAPESLLVLGAGPVGLEFTQVFARFGSAVTVVETGDRILGPAEPEVSEALERVLRAEGVDVRVGAGVRRVAHSGGRFRVEFDQGDPVEVERLLVATGRRTDLAALGVGAVGLDEAARTIPVDERLRAADGVWAIGDVTGHGAFTHTSVYQAPIAAADILGERGPAADYRAVPSVTFTDPEVGMVGLTEKAATDRGLRVRTGSAEIPSAVRGWIHKAGNDGLIKVVADADRDVLVGATAVAPGGGEVLGALAVAVHAEVPLATLRRMIYAYPTFHRAISSAVDDLDAS